MGRFQLNLNHMLSFYWLAKEKSFSKAAEMLAITQPAVTQHVRGLEIQFGVKLINLKKKHVHLTKAGERLFAYAEELYNHAVLTENFLKNYHSNNISIGIASPLLLYLTSLIDQYREKYPAVRVTIKEASSQSLTDELLDYKHDIAIHGAMSPYNKRLRCFRIDSDEKMVFVSGADFPSPDDSYLRWDQLASLPLIVKTEGSAARAIVRHEFKKRGLNPKIGMEVSNVALAKELARQNKGVALMFEPNIRQEVARGELKVIRIEGEEIRVGAIDILTNREERLSSAIQSFLNMIRKQFGNNFHELSIEQQEETWKKL